jgi:hypothetical protein
MTNFALEAQANELGIPMQMQIDNNIRQAGCDAHMANLASIEGTTALYKGECANRHVYEARFQIEELKKMARIENGEIVIGGQKGYQAEELGEY